MADIVIINVAVFPTKTVFLIKYFGMKMKFGWENNRLLGERKIVYSSMITDWLVTDRYMWNSISIMANRAIVVNLFTSHY